LLASFKKMLADGRLTAKATPHNLGLLLTPASLWIPSKPVMQSKVCALQAEAEKNVRWNNLQEGCSQWQ